MEHLKRHITALDILVIIISTVAVCTAIFAHSLNTAFSLPDSFSVDVNGEKHTYSLSKDNTIDISSCGVRLTLEVRDSKLSVISSDCPDGICCASGEISRAGQSIVCLPAKVAVTIIPEVSGDADWIFG